MRAALYRCGMWLRRELTRIDEDGRESVVRVEIGDPVQALGEEPASVRVRIEGIGARIASDRRIYGEDSMQALMLGIGYARTLLESDEAFAAGRLFWIERDVGLGLDVPSPPVAG